MKKKIVCFICWKFWNLNMIFQTWMSEDFVFHYIKFVSFCKRILWLPNLNLIKVDKFYIYILLYRYYFHCEIHVKDTKCADCSYSEKYKESFFYALWQNMTFLQLNNNCCLFCIWKLSQITLYSFSVTSLVWTNLLCFYF